MTPPDPFRNLGVRQTSAGGEIRVFSRHAESLELCLFDDADPNWIVKTVPLRRDDHGIWGGRSRSLSRGRRYALRATGPTTGAHVFDEQSLLLDPYSRGVIRAPFQGSPGAVGSGIWRSVVLDTSFDWADSRKPHTPLDRTVIYEAHPKGLTKLSPRVPEHLRGSYAGLAHESTIEYLRDLGVTAVELLPVHAFVSEQRLIKQGLVNYWGYNPLAYFAPHAAYASREAQSAGPAAVLREFQGMVKLLHEAGLEVILDVVFNHTSEEGPTGPRSSFRGLDNATYYRHDANGAYIDVTGCGNTLDFGEPIVQRLALDALRFWANDLQVDGFRFDLAVTLGRDGTGAFRSDHPLLLAIRDDPALADVKLIAEPWDVGYGGWQTGNFPAGWSEWNDRYRDRVRDFWLTEARTERQTGSARSGIGDLTSSLVGSAGVFADERGPLASVNFITAHDGFTLADLTSYDTKHNLGNGEENRDGTDGNRSFNFGVEGPTTIPSVLAARRQALRNLLGTLLLSAGVPMITAGDEAGRSQQGNNNAYCHDSPLTWLSWTPAEWQSELRETTRHLIRLRRDNAALRPTHLGAGGESSAAAGMEWFDPTGAPMSTDGWHDPARRTVQYLATSAHGPEKPNRVLLVVHAVERPTEVVLPRHPGVASYLTLWDSADASPREDGGRHSPGSTVPLATASMRLFLAE